MHIDRDAPLDAAGLRIGIAVSRYHHEITEALWKGAVDAFTGAGGSRADLDVVAAPGAFELTVIAQALAARDDLDGVVAIGCIVRGETSHDQHLAQAIASGLTRVALDTRKPVAFGVLTCQTLHQARARAGGEHGNKGVEAMTAAIEAIRTLRSRHGSAGTMTTARDVRRCALQALYQFDAGNHESPDIVRESLVHSAGSERTHEQGFRLAEAAWAMREQADRAISERTPDWPTHRQPVVDRSILRLAYYEIVSEVTPPKVAINEAVELAREFSTDKSPLFVNGVLDRIYKAQRGAAENAVDDDGADQDDGETDPAAAPAEPVEPPGA